MKVTLPELYALTSTGAIQQWAVESYPVSDQVGCQACVRTVYGQVGGKLQETTDVIKEGKNLGKANATTAVEQAALKAKQMWDKKVKSGYVESLEAAKAGTDELGGIEPMLAFPEEDKAKYAEFPCIVQPKLDGFRCVAIIENGKASLWSRTRKPVTTLPLVIEQLEALFSGTTITLDGELYSHSLKADFNQIASIVKRKDTHSNHAKIEYHVYDVIGEGGLEERTQKAVEVIGKGSAPNIKLVRTELSVQSREAMTALFHQFLLEGYEGAMMRSPRYSYEHKRSAGLLKVKVMQDAEFKVIGLEEGSGKLTGKLGSFICVTADGQEFSCAMDGEQESLTEYFVNFKAYKGKMLTIQFQGLTPKGKPRFPRGQRFRIDL